MAGVAGIASKNEVKKVTAMLNRMRHRGKHEILVLETNDTTIGIKEVLFSDPIHQDLPLSIMVQTIPGYYVLPLKLKP